MSADNVLRHQQTAATSHFVFPDVANHHQQQQQQMNQVQQQQPQQHFYGPFGPAGFIPNAYYPYYGPINPANPTALGIINATNAASTAASFNPYFNHPQMPGAGNNNIQQQQQQDQMSQYGSTAMAIGHQLPVMQSAGPAYYTQSLPNSPADPQRMFVFNPGFVMPAGNYAHYAPTSGYPQTPSTPNAYHPPSLHVSGFSQQ
jgi:hypothetical protein